MADGSLAPPRQERAEGEVDRDLLRDLYRRMVLIRRFEERVLDLFGQGKLFGTTHAYIGQEAVAAGLFPHLGPPDLVFSNHRCHGHYLMHQEDPEGLMAELMGKASGACGGRGGSQHLCRGTFHSNGVQGGIVPVLVGMTLAARFQGSPAIGTVFLGDGTLGEGQAYEAMNLASLWGLPVLFVIEDNFYSQSTPSHLQVAGAIADRPRAFAIPTVEVASNDVLVTWERSRQVVAEVRQERRPRCIVFHTFRLCPHSKSDDGRPESVIAPWRALDPLLLAEAHLDAAEAEAARAQADERVERAVRAAEAAPFPEDAGLEPLPEPVPADPGPTEGRVVAALQRGLRRALKADGRVVLLGEDLVDPYGGAFKVTRGLSTDFPGRVLPTPVSEAAITGVAAGLALQGMRPVLEIMFGDFLTLCVDQLVNYVSKFRGMYGGKASCPMVLRTPMGGRRGYGPTHSQTLEKLLLGVPELRLVAASVLHDCEAMLVTAILGDEAPVIFLENKLLYTRPLLRPDGQGWVGNFQVRWTGGAYPAARLSPVGFGRADAVLATYGGMAEIVLEAAERLILEHEVACEVVVYAQIQPLDLGPLREGLGRCGRLVTVEEGVLEGGWGAEVLAAAAREGLLKGRAGRVGALCVPIPACRGLEDRVLPGVGEVVAETLRCLGG